MAQQLSGQNLLQKILKFKEVDERVRNDPAVHEKLEQVCKFLHEHETAEMKDCTHEVIHGFQDWWLSSKSTKKLAIVEENTLNMFYLHAATMWGMGIPLTLGERRTNEFTLFQDVQMTGTAQECIKAEDLVGAQNQFMRLLGETIGELFPSKQNLLEGLHLAVFDGSGYYSATGTQITYVRFIWPQIVVDVHKACTVRDYILHKLNSTEEQDVKNLENRMKQLHQDNKWNSSFFDGNYAKVPAPIRMPLNDSVGEPPCQNRENRPFEPMGVFGFGFAEQQLSKVEEIARPGDFEGHQHQWLKLGSIRKAAGTPTDELKIPQVSFKMSEPTVRSSYGGYQQRQGGSNSTSASGRSGGQLGARSVRTHTGSPGGGGGGLGAARGPSRSGVKQSEETQTRLEREFRGSLQDFREKLITTYGEGHQITENEGILVWIYNEDTSCRIEFRDRNKRVYLTGKETQLRAVLNPMTKYLNAVPDLEGSVAGSRSQWQSSGRSGYGGSQAAGPSQAFSKSKGPGSVSGRSGGPVNLASCGSVISRASASGQRAGVQVVESSERTVIANFESQAQGELGLRIGDRVFIDKDPDLANGELSVDRWVYGRNVKTNENGWFPYSATKAIKLEAVTE
eukprot:TRINITY_DN64110_c0_g1_i1.p1 TRINITY_DN64110_c0_g1~~TRINITY_DN64110_c0_g1_i1.p1  ORF type:complete len:623 (-),score=80.10 TRINITY_DN64110_c0_g1_i1:124-1992(-)